MHRLYVGAGPVLPHLAPVWSQSNCMIGVRESGWRSVQQEQDVSSVAKVERAIRRWNTRKYARKISVGWTRFSSDHIRTCPLDIVPRAIVMNKYTLFYIFSVSRIHQHRGASCLIMNIWYMYLFFMKQL